MYRIYNTTLLWWERAYAVCFLLPSDEEEFSFSLSDSLENQFEKKNYRFPGEQKNIQETCGNTCDLSRVQVNEELATVLR